MVKIRKKTSKRTTTRLREKVKHKVSEAKKKSKKAAKKDVTWKSNKPKDIGIPNSFPYKDQLLAEAQAEKARVEEEKAARREAAKAGTSATLASTAALAAALAADSAMQEDLMDEDDDDGSEKLVQDPSLKLHAKSLRKVLEMSDVIVEVLDARDPVGTRCRAVEREMKTLDGGRKKLVLVLNKIDLVPPQVVQAWLEHLRLQAPTIPFKSSTQQQRNHLSASSAATPQSASGSSTKPLMELIKGFRLQSSSSSSGPSSASTSGGEPSGKAVKTSLTIGLVGHPNVGKSSLINTLKRSKACSVAPTPGWTKEVQEVVLEKGIRVLDCPGVVVEQRGEVEGALKGMMKAEEVNDPKAPVEAILARCKREHLQMLYNIAYFDSVTSFLLEVARAKGRLRKGGVPDLDGTARSILRDWVAGRIPYYTSPPTKEATAQLKQQVSTEAQQVGTVSDSDLGGSTLLSGFSAPAIDLIALFGEADAVAFEADGAGAALVGKKAVRLQDGAMGVESEEADVGWAAPEEDEEQEVEMVEDDELGLDDLLEEEEEEDDDDEEMEEDEPTPAPVPVKAGKKRGAAAVSSRSDIVSVAPPAKKGRQAKSVSFSSTPLGPTGSTSSASVPTSTTAQTRQITEDAGDVGLNKKAKKDAKKNKKKAAKRELAFKEEVGQATREFGPDVELPSKPQPAKTVKAGKGGAPQQAYSFDEFFQGAK
ncbi:hypothetical protein JCM11641_005109 [Rhodosporidiobolus odoratus]